MEVARAARHPRDRGHRPGPRRPRTRPPRRLDRRRRLLLLLPDEEPRRVGRRRRGRHGRPRAGRAGPPAALARREPALPPQDRRHDGPPGRAPGRPAAREAAPARRLATRIAAASAPRCAPASRASSVELPAPGVRRAPTTSTTCSSCAARTRDALREHLAERGVSSARCTTRSRSTGPGLRRSRATARGACRWPSGCRSGSARCPCSPTMSDDDVARVIDAVHDFDEERSDQR